MAGGMYAAHACNQHSKCMLIRRKYLRVDSVITCGHVYAKSCSTKKKNNRTFVDLANSDEEKLGDQKTNHRFLFLAKIIIVSNNL